MLILFIFICDLRQKVAQAQLTSSQALDGMRKINARGEKACRGENSVVESQATCKATSSPGKPAGTGDYNVFGTLVQTVLLM